MASGSERTVTITLSQYMDLYRDSITLGELDRAGVDNWHGYDCIDHNRINRMCHKKRNHIIHGEDQ